MKLQRKISIQYQFKANKNQTWLWDEQLGKRILENLLVNAMYHNPPGTQIWVDVEVIGNRLCIKIEDNGQGMKPQEMQPLISMDSVACSSNSGLWIVKQFVDRLQGKIEVESQQGKGTKIKLCFFQR